MKYLALLAALIAAPALAATPVKIKDQSFRDADGHRVLKETVIVGAHVPDVWKAFTTDEGFTRWAVPVAHITPGNGGLIEFALADGGKIGDPNNVKNRIDVYLPDRLIVMHNEFVPAGGPMDPATFGTVRTMIEFAPSGGRQTRVTETVIGFGESLAYDDLYTHLRGGNAEYLSALAASFSGSSAGVSAQQATSNTH